MRPGRATLQTYSLLGERAAPPDEYEIVTSRLLYYVGRGFEVEVPIGAWYRTYQAGTRLQHADWDRFEDPRRTTYTLYTRLARAREEALDLALAALPEDADRGLSSSWRDTLSRVLAPLRHPLHGLHMLASYLGQMAPSGRITLCALFQAADEIRRIERLAIRLAELQARWPGLGADARRTWQEDPAWQPARECIERLLVTYDFGEAFAGLQLGVRPLLDRAVEVLARCARSQGDLRTATILRALDEDAAWHAEWSLALAQFALAQPENRDVLAQAIGTWRPRAELGARGMLEALGVAADLPAIAAAHREALEALGL